MCVISHKSMHPSVINDLFHTLNDLSLRKIWKKHRPVWRRTTARPAGGGQPRPLTSLAAPPPGAPAAEADGVVLTVQVMMWGRAPSRAGMPACVPLAAWTLWKCFTMDWITKLFDCRDRAERSLTITTQGTVINNCSHFSFFSG